MSEEVLEKKNKKPVVIIAVLIAVIAIVAILIVSLTSKSGNANSYQSKLDEAQRYVDELNYELAIASFEEAIAIEPKAVDAYIGLADVYVAMDDYDSAMAVIEDALNNVDSDNIAVIEEYKANLEVIIQTSNDADNTDFVETGFDNADVDSETDLDYGSYSDTVFYLVGSEEHVVASFRPIDATYYMMNYLDMGIYAPAYELSYYFGDSKPDYLSDIDIPECLNDSSSEFTISVNEWTSPVPGYMDNSDEIYDNIKVYLTTGTCETVFNESWEDASSDATLYLEEIGYTYNGFPVIYINCNEETTWNRDVEGNFGYIGRAGETTTDFAEAIIVPYNENGDFFEMIPSSSLYMSDDGSKKAFLIECFLEMFECEEK